MARVPPATRVEAWRFRVRRRRRAMRAALTNRQETETTRHSRARRPESTLRALRHLGLDEMACLHRVHQ